MSKDAHIDRAREVARELGIATAAIRRATMFIELLREQLGAMPDDLDDGTEPVPGDTYADGP